MKAHEAKMKTHEVAPTAYLATVLVSLLLASKQGTYCG